MYNKSLTYKVGVILLAGTLALASPVATFAGVSMVAEEDSQYGVFSIRHFNLDTGITDYEPVTISANAVINGVLYTLDSQFISCTSNMSSGTLSISNNGNCGNA